MPGIRKIIWEKLGFTKTDPGCCGNLWGSRRFSPQVDPVTTRTSAGEEIAAPEAAGEMNLRAAGEEERQMRPADSSMAAEPTLISWLEKEEEEEREKVVTGLGENCCVCMERKKGAAFIPCGHAFCRVCARDLWIERRSCALCNQTILEILDLF
ncbi:hypothetical protein KSP39_PZI015564 [Platanthera zijinensis]|uniref:RING-type domain-containing protein n=1 Tax=Platanthera zijinensis TaxID=2320716 RepID=A0AAP0G1F2_9ASPA